MPQIQIKPPQVDEVTVESQVVVEPQVTLEPQLNVQFKDKTPANWIILVDSDDSIMATNTNTRETFKGSIEEFNKLLRG